MPSPEILVCDNPVFDFGTAWAGERIDCEFKLRNTTPHGVWGHFTQACSCIGMDFDFFAYFGPFQELVIPIKARTVRQHAEITKVVTVRIERIEPASQPAK